MKKIFYAHSGGVTSVINSTLVGLIQAAIASNIEVLIGIYGIRGLIQRQYFSSKDLTQEDLKKILHTPGGSFGSCRYKPTVQDFHQIQKNIQKDGIDAIVYQGGNDSQSTLLALSRSFKEYQSSCRTLGLPKTIDNDLMGTEVSPGFGSSAFFLNVSMRQLCLDLRSMCMDSTKVYIMETMGRHSGWLTASTGLSHDAAFPGPHLLLVPERSQSLEDILNKVQDSVDRDGYCSIAISEGYDAHFDRPGSIEGRDLFGNRVLSGSGQALKDLLSSQLKMKTRLCIPDYLQRSFSLIPSSRDFEQSFALGQEAISTLMQSDLNEHMLTIVSTNTEPYWSFSQAPLFEVALHERRLPLEYLSDTGWGLSASGKKYMQWAIGPELEQTFERFWPHVLSQKRNSAF